MPLSLEQPSQRIWDSKKRKCLWSFNLFYLHTKIIFFYFVWDQIVPHGLRNLNHFLNLKYIYIDYFKSTVLCFAIVLAYRSIGPLISRTRCSRMQFHPKHWHLNDAMVLLTFFSGWFRASLPRENVLIWLKGWAVVDLKNNSTSFEQIELSDLILWSLMRIRIKISLLCRIDLGHQSILAFLIILLSFVRIQQSL